MYNIAFLIIMFLFFYLVLQLFGSRKNRLEKRLEFYLLNEGVDAVGHGEVSSEKKTSGPGLFQSIKLSNHRIKKMVNKRKTSVKVEQLLAGAGSPWTAGEYMAFRWIFGVILGGLFLLLFTHPILFLLGFIIGFLFPKLMLSSKRKKRIRAFNDQLQDMITTIISSMRAGYSFTQSLKAVCEESSFPMNVEIESLLKEMQYGISMEEAFHHLYERMPSKDLDIMIQAILIQRQVGGNLATVLTMIVDTIRERQKIQAQIKALTAQGRLSGAVIGSLPFALGFIIYLIQPKFMAVLFTDTIGQILLAAALVSGILGFFFIQKLIKIEV